METESEQDAQARMEDPRIQELNEFFRYPDRSHDWKTWLRQLLEELLVIDAVSIYRRPSLAGGPFSLEILDGSTIKPNLDEFGRINSYEQWLYGKPEETFAMPGQGNEKVPEELLYVPRNPRPSRVYGYSPVEQIIVTVNIALRRQQAQLGFYTDGNIPEGFCEAPQTWDPNVIEAFWKKFDAYMSGNAAARSKMIMLPFGAKPTFPKMELVKTEMDDWLSSIVCYAMGVSRTALIKPMNRASSQTDQTMAQEEGLQPLMAFVEHGVMTPIVEKWFGYDDIEFAFELREDVDRESQANVNKIYFSMGALSINEIREELGKEPIDGGDVYGFLTPMGFTPLPGQAADISAYATDEPDPIAGSGAPGNGNGGGNGNGKPGAKGNVGKAVSGQKKRLYAPIPRTRPHTSSSP